MVNESPTDKVIRELREENEKLKLMLTKGVVPADMDFDMGSGGGSKAGEVLLKLAWLLWNIGYSPVFVCLCKV